MARPKNSKKLRRVPWALGGLVLLLLTLLVLLQSSNVWKSVSVDSASDTLLLYALSSLNFVAFVIFGFIFLRSIIKLARERRAFQLGAKIKTRLLVYFFAVSIMPIIAMAVFSYLFMNRALERWFTQIPENVVRQAREVQDQAVEDQAAILSETARMLVITLENKPIDERIISEIRKAGNLTYIAVLSSENRMLFSAAETVALERQTEFDQTIELAMNESGEGQLLTDGKGFDVASAQFPDGRRLLIVPEFRSEESVSPMVDSALVEFDRLKERDATVRQIGLLTLGILTFLLIFASSWTAFYIARGLTVPIKALAEGADKIAQGSLGHQVEVLAEDELALLVSAFNQMSAKLEENSAEIRERRRYIETVLQSLPTGVISFDAENRVGTINKAAIGILRLEPLDFSNRELNALVNAENREVIERLISRKRTGHASEQTILKKTASSDIDDGLPVALTATALPAQRGAVLVIEDLSELIAAQRASAWQEVARRMAHEIKNPLTPIQLSAERIAKRFNGLVSAEGTDSRRSVTAAFAQQLSRGAGDPSLVKDTKLIKVVKEGTDTILREVQSLKFMVDEFSRFARLPDAKLKLGDLNDAIRQALAMYEDRLPHVILREELAGDLPMIMLDSEQLKRVFVNVIENSVEAFDSMETEKVIWVRTRSDFARGVVVVEIADNGKGIKPGDLQKLFQPYFSTKGRGTGLGLAIVHRIVSDHGGKINVTANHPRGAKFTIELPI